MKGNSSISFSNEHAAKSSTENNNKFRLFGVVLHDPTQVQETDQDKGSIEKDESVNSSAASSTVTEKLSDDVAEEKNKFVCEYCLKAFGNSQALGGHQNAHKKERMKKKRLQLQARKASLNCYIQPIHNSYNKISSTRNYYGRNNPVWFYDPSCHAPEFSLFEEPQISFSPYGQDLERNSPEQISRWYAALPDRFPFQQQDAETHQANKIVSDLNTSKKKLSCNRKNLDLELGLTLDSTI